MTGVESLLEALLSISLVLALSQSERDSVLEVLLREANKKTLAYKIQALEHLATFLSKCAPTQITQSVFDLFIGSAKTTSWPEDATESLKLNLTILCLNKIHLLLMQAVADQETGNVIKQGLSICKRP